MAYSNYQTAFDAYKTGWSIGNSGDPNDDYTNIWQPIINSLNTLDFTSISPEYTTENLQQMTTADEWNSFVATFEKTVNEQVTNFSNYADYLKGVSTAWNTAQLELKEAIATFNSLTSSTVQIYFWEILFLIPLKVW
ncbi:hypothetical protein GQR36_16595 [Enterococcus termitis]